MQSFLLRGILAWCAVISLGRAEPGVVVSLSSVGDRIRAQNPDLAAARFRIGEASGRLIQSGRLDNPELGIELSHEPRYRERSLELSFSQRFPLTGRLKLEKAVSATEVEAARAEVREVERQLIARAREGVVEILILRQRRTLLNSQAESSRQFAEVLAESAAKGESSSLDAGQARLESSGAMLELRQLDAGEAAAVGAIKPLLGMLPGETLHVTGSLPAASLPASLRPDPSARPDLQAARLQARAALQGVALEQARSREDVEAGLFLGAERTEDAPEGYDREGMIGLRFTLPLPWWNRNEGAVEEARARQQRLTGEAVALDRGIRLEAETAQSEMVQWLRLLGEIDNDLLPLAADQSSAAEAAYRQGQGEISQVFRARDRRLQLQASRLDALRQFHLARVRFDAALAKP